MFIGVNLIELHMITVNANYLITGKTPLLSPCHGHIKGSSPLLYVQYSNFFPDVVNGYHHEQ
jgi:hypothetical protein